MSTDQMYRAPETDAPRTTVDLMGQLQTTKRTLENVRLPGGSTQAAGMTPAVRARLLLELAQRSVRSDNGLDRGRGDEINRDAWGIR
jgi:hypothetical protein